VSLALALLEFASTICTHTHAGSCCPHPLWKPLLGLLERWCKWPSYIHWTRSRCVKVLPALAHTHICKPCPISRSAGVQTGAGSRRHPCTCICTQMPHHTRSSTCTQVLTDTHACSYVQVLHKCTLTQHTSASNTPPPLSGALPSQRHDVI